MASTGHQAGRISDSESLSGFRLIPDMHDRLLSVAYVPRGYRGRLLDRHPAVTIHKGLSSSGLTVPYSLTTRKCVSIGAADSKALQMSTFLEFTLYDSIVVDCPCYMMLRGPLGSLYE